jgi:hypothetical protein
MRLHRYFKKFHAITYRSALTAGYFYTRRAHIIHKVLCATYEVICALMYNSKRHYEISRLSTFNLVRGNLKRCTRPSVHLFLKTPHIITHTKTCTYIFRTLYTNVAHKYFKSRAHSATWFFPTLPVAPTVRIQFPSLNCYQNIYFR